MGYLEAQISLRPKLEFFAVPKCRHFSQTPIVGQCRQAYTCFPQGTKPFAAMVSFHIYRLDILFIFSVFPLSNCAGVYPLWFWVLLHQGAESVQEEPICVPCHSSLGNSLYNSCNLFCLLFWSTPPLFTFKIVFQVSVMFHICMYADLTFIFVVVVVLIPCSS